MKKAEENLPKIIYAWNYMDWGGAQIYFLGLIKEAKKNFDVQIVLPEKSDRQLLKFFEKMEIPYHFIEAEKKTKISGGLLGKAEKHYRKFQSESLMLKRLFEFDLKNSLIHIELAPWQSLLSLIRLCRKTNVFITTHNSLPEVSKRRFLLWKIKLKIISRYKNFNVFCSNEDAKNYFARLYAKEFAEKIKITYTFASADEINQALETEFDRERLCKKHKIPNGKFLVFCVGQFIDRKGRWTFLRAAQKICRETDEIAFVWVSNSKPDAADLRQLEKFGLKDKFRLLISDEIGNDRIELLNVFRLADVFALPSFQEGLPVALLEAMALGIPSISTNINAVPEALKNFETGILIRPADQDALAEAIQKLKKDKSLREKLAEKGREFVLERFEQKAVARIAVEAYKKSLRVE